MPKDTEINIKKLAANEKIFMVVFSGRELSEIKNHLKFPNVTYAGNHGLEVEYPSGKKFKIEMPEELLEKHNKLVAELKEKVSQIKILDNWVKFLISLRLSCLQVVLSGAWVEDKKISVTYHYKGVTDKLKAKLIADAKALIQAHGFQLIETPYALEGKPRVNWDKG